MRPAVPSAVVGLPHPSWPGLPELVVEGCGDHDVTEGDRVGGLVGHVREASRGWQYETGLGVPHETGKPPPRGPRGISHVAFGG
jgi:hypothetical protein